MKISRIWIYPIKSLGGIPLRSAEFDSMGFKNDRRWMLVDEKGKFLSQRTHPKMAAFKVRLTANGVSVTSPSRKRITIPFEPDTRDSISVTVWGSRCRGDLYSEKFNRFFSDSIGVECRLVKISDKVKRPLSRFYAVHDGDHVGFADGYPFLLAGEASLKHLNSRLEVPVPMERFRPNIVVSGTVPFEEDSWKRIKIGAREFHIVKPCARCVMTTVDQSIGEVTGTEPLKTLSRFRTTVRKGKRKVLFGQNLVAEKSKGKVSVGDDVKVIATKHPPKFV